MVLLLKDSFRKISGFAVAVSLGLAAGCGSSPSEGEESSRVLGTQGPFLSAQTVAGHVRNAGFPRSLVNTMVRIARCESSLGTGSFAWGQGRRHTGLWQISDLHKSACGYGSSSLASFRNTMTDPAANARCAYVVYKNAGNSLRPWDCYRFGRI